MVFEDGPGIDLHAHTTASDGSLSPAALVREAHALGLAALAVTDHDTVAGLPEAAREARGLGLDLLPGVELSVEDGGGRFHLLGYGFDPQNPELQDKLTTLRRGRAARNDRMAEKMAQLGLPVTMDDVRAAARKQSGEGEETEVIARPHFAQALIDKGVVSSVKEAFDRYLSTGKPLYQPKDVLTPREAVALLHRAGGVAVMAHPGLVPLPQDALAARVASLHEDDGLDGLEAFYSQHSAADTERFLGLARRHGLLVTGGSDFHGTPKPHVPLGVVFQDRPAPRALLAALRTRLPPADRPTEGFPPMTFMLDEIRQQPDVVRRIVREELPRVEALAEQVRGRKVAYAYVAARGTSDNAALYGKYLLEIQHGLPVALAAPSVFTLYDAVPRFGENALVLGISQSGAAPDVIEVIRRAREAGALTACITNEDDSELVRAAEFPLLIGAGEEIGVAATKTYTGSLALLALLSTALDPGRPDRLEHLRRTADVMEKALDLDDAVHHLVERYADLTGCVILGRGYNHATAAELALKLTETCGVAARAYSAADFQHGPIAQVVSGYPCLLFAPDGKAFAPMAQLAEKLRAQHPALIGFAHDAAFLAGSETAVRIPGAIAEWVSPLVYILAGQLFTYWLCTLKGLDPDSPRGLTKITRTL